jgi:hypothetical protein
MTPAAHTFIPVVPLRCRDKDLLELFGYTPQWFKARIGKHFVEGCHFSVVGNQRSWNVAYVHNRIQNWNNDDAHRIFLSAKR